MLLFVVVFQGPSSAATKTIDIKSLKFTVPTLTIAAGDTVTWSNLDTVQHTITSKGGSELASPFVKGGGTFSHTFAQPGTFAYFCEVHPDMMGKIVVTQAAAAAPAPGPATPAAPSPSAPSPPPRMTMTPAPVSPPVPPAQSAPADTPAPSPVPAAPPVPGAGCTSAGDPMTPLVKHLKVAHFEESPGQQVTDLLNVNQYTLTHTVLVEHMLYGSC